MCEKSVKIFLVYFPLGFSCKKIQNFSKTFLLKTISKDTLGSEPSFPKTADR